MAWARGLRPKRDFRSFVTSFTSLFFNNAQGDHQHTGMHAYEVSKILVLMLITAIVRFSPRACRPAR